MNLEPESECQLLGKEGIFLQTILAILSFCTLIVKRHKERPRRSWKIWFLDTSKQVFSAGVAHALNLVLAIWLSSREVESSGGSCDWYFITIIFDTTLGVLMSCWLLVMMEKVFEHLNLPKLKSGNYFKIVPNLDPVTCDEKPRLIFIDICSWFAQLLLWIIIVLIAKVILAYMQAVLERPLINITEFLFTTIKDLHFIRLMIVTVIVPVIGNSFQFWISDNFLKKNEFTEDEDYILRGTFFDEDLLENPKFSHEESSGLERMNTTVSMTVEMGPTNSLKTSLK